jgi:hypothetical protein
MKSVTTSLAIAVCFAAFSMLVANALSEHRIANRTGAGSRAALRVNQILEQQSAGVICGDDVDCIHLNAGSNAIEIEEQRAK